jgi:hypothetical protein
MSDDTPKFDGRRDIMAGFADSAHERGEFFFYVKIPQDVQPLERGDRYEDPLHAALHEASLGEVTGGGSQLGEGKTIEYCGLDVVVRDRDRGLELIRSVMLSLDAPPDTVIEEYLPTYQEHALTPPAV